MKNDDIKLDIDVCICVTWVLWLLCVGQRADTEVCGVG